MIEIKELHYFYSFTMTFYIHNGKLVPVLTYVIADTNSHALEVTTTPITTTTITTTITTTTISTTTTITTTISTTATTITTTTTKRTATMQLVMLPRNRKEA